LTLASDFGQRRTISLDAFQSVVIWLLFAVSFYVKSEPAPVEIAFAFAVILFLPYGLSISSLAAPLILLLVLYNVGGVLSYLQIMEDDKARMFVITSAYMAVTAMFFAFYVATDPQARMPLIKSGLTFGAFIASVLGIVGALNIAGTRDMFSLYGRAMGAFKDPNVFSTYLILPALMLLQGFLTGTQKHKLPAFIGLATILAALFLAFSRGAWLNFLAATALLVILTFVLSNETRLRNRVFLQTVLGGLLALGLLLALLSIPDFNKLFLDRFTLIKNYDAGETGRFGNQLNSIPLLMERPLGFGPMQFRAIFRQDPHNTFLNAFASYGWLGGVTYIALIVTTVVAGAKAVFTRTPWQGWCIVVFCPLVTTVLQGVQIDTDHWRHFYWMLGMMWGLFAASVIHERLVGAVGFEPTTPTPPA
jgi:O-Antigen ligase